MAKQTIAILDYGSGNLRSAQKSFQHVGKQFGHDINVPITNRPEDILRADRIILPGQGAFHDCMGSLSAIPGMIEALNHAVLNKGTPFLGICVGMQLMASRGIEKGATAGLNWIEGDVVPIITDDKSLKIPHMGWNDLIYLSANSQQDNRHFVLRSTESLENFYFVHSFIFQCRYNHNVLAMTDYGHTFPAVVGRDNIIGVQFHPEKSHEAGAKMLSDFLEWRP